MPHFVKPLDKNIIVEMLEKEMITAGGIVLSKADPKEVTKGRVLAVGSRCLYVKEGDIILPNWQTAIKSESTTTNANHDTFFLVNEDDVVCIFD
jgi:co-chaperonin GroES (HSP10)